MFEPILEQAPAKRQLNQMIESGRLPFGLLLYGPVAVGKTKLVTSFVRKVLCRGSKQWDCPCSPCKKVLNKVHPDVHLVAPNEQGRITVETVRSVVQHMELKPNEAPRKFVLFEQAEAMNSQASNALLKVLEEPLGNATLVLSTGFINRVLDTIRSRCQLVRCNFLSDSALGELLQGVGQVYDESVIELMNGSFTPDVIPKELNLLKNAWQMKDLEEPHTVDSDSLRRELVYMGSSLAEMLRTGHYRVHEMEFRRVPAHLVLGLFNQVDRSLHFLKRGVKPYLVLHYIHNRIREVQR